MVSLNDKVQFITAITVVWFTKAAAAATSVIAIITITNVSSARVLISLLTTAILVTKTIKLVADIIVR